VTGASAFGDGVPAHPVEVRDDGGLWVGLPAETPHARTAADVLAEALVAFGVTDVFGMVGHSNLGMADALRVQEERGGLRFNRSPTTTGIYTGHPTIHVDDGPALLAVRSDPDLI
jgi:hypothetical protein